jgi:hypothetical protein
MDGETSMKIEQYEVTVKFDLAVLQGHDRAERVALELNQLFHEMVKVWSKDKQAIVSPTKTTLDSEIEVRQA